MGMFDRVLFRCPKCGTELEEQSKAGECLLSDFSEDAVPNQLAQDILGNEVFCEACQRSYIIVLRPKPQDTVAMDLARIDNCNASVRMARHAKAKREGSRDAD